MKRVSLTVEDREAIIDVLGDTPDTLAELHDLLMHKHMYRALDSIGGAQMS